MGIKVTGLITPLDPTDTYPVIDPLLGIDGLRCVTTLSEMYNIPLELRRAGMVVGIPGAFNTVTYYKLIPGLSWSVGSPSDWNLMFDFGTAGYGALPIKNNITSETINVPVNYQYLIYGDLNIGASGSLINQGSTVIVNGDIVLTSDGTYSNIGAGTISFVTLKVEKKFSASFSATAGQPYTINHNLNSSDIVYTVRENLNFVFPNIEITDNNSIQLTSFATISNGRINIMA
jgi:hypothetical protein